MTHFEQFLGLSQIVAQTLRSASFMWALPPALSADRSESLHTDTLHTLSLPAVEAEDSARKAESGRKKKSGLSGCRFPCRSVPCCCVCGRAAAAAEARLPSARLWIGINAMDKAIKALFVPSVTTG